MGSHSSTGWGVSLEGRRTSGAESAWGSRPVWWLRIDALQATMSQAKAGFVCELS